MNILKWIVDNKKALLSILAIILPLLGYGTYEYTRPSVSVTPETIEDTSQRDNSENHQNSANNINHTHNLTRKEVESMIENTLKSHRGEQEGMLH